MQQEAYLLAVGSNDIVYYTRLITPRSGLFQFLFTTLKQGLNIDCETCKPPLETLLESIDNLNVHERTCLKPVYFKYSTSMSLNDAFAVSFPLLSQNTFVGQYLMFSLTHTYLLCDRVPCTCLNTNPFPHKLTKLKRYCSQLLNFSAPFSKLVLF